LRDKCPRPAAETRRRTIIAPLPGSVASKREKDARETIDRIRFVRPLPSDYRSELRIAVQALLLLLARTQDADQKREIEYNLCMVLTHQLDWSLDDLELDSTDRQIVDRVLADLPAPDFEIELNDRLRTVIIT